MVWVFDEDGGKYQKKQYDNLFRLTKNAKIATNGSKLIDLHEYLKNKKFTDAEHLHNSVFLDKDKKDHFFTIEQANKAYTYYSNKKHQLGGEEDQSGKGALNRIILRYINFLRALIPENVKQSLDGPVGMIRSFSLNNLETIPMFGQFLGMSVSVALAINKNVAKMLQQYVPLVFSPLPFGGLIGNVVGYFLSLFPIFLNVMAHISRGNLGEAYTQSLAGIPLFGPALQNWSESIDRLVEEFGEKRAIMVRQLKSSPIFGWLGRIIDTFIIDPNYVGNPEEDALIFKQKFNSLKDQAKSNFDSANKQLRDQISTQFTQPIPVDRGGKTLSTYRSKNKKWRKQTLRKLKKH